jgi:hypothetical protein
VGVPFFCLLFFGQAKKRRAGALSPAHQKPGVRRRAHQKNRSSPNRPLSNSARLESGRNQKISRTKGNRGKRISIP